MVCVDIWFRDLDVCDGQYASLALLLTAAELKRANQYVHRLDARRFIVRRGHLRTILANYVGVRAQALVLAAGTHGKPFLETPDQIHFNLSHSGGLMMLVVSPDCPVGADIEKVEPMTEDIARVAFTERECAQLAALSPSHRLREHYKLWTCKEAVLKAHGTGLMVEPQHVDIGFLDDVGDGYGNGQWASVDWGEVDRQQPSLNARPNSVYAFAPRSGFMAAIATVAHDRHLKMTMRGDHAQ